MCGVKLLLLFDVFSISYDACSIGGAPANDTGYAVTGLPTIDADEHTIGRDSRRRLKGARKAAVNVLRVSAILVVAVQPRAVTIPL